MPGLADLLDRESHMLEVVGMRLAVLRLLLTTGESRFLGLAGDELDSVAGAIGTLEVVRTLAAEDAAAGLGLARDASLRTIAAALDDVDERERLEAARSSMSAALSTLLELRDSLEELSSAQLGAVRESLERLRFDVAGYSSEGVAVSSSPPGSRVESL